METNKNIQDIRKKFFLECTEPSMSDGLQKICLAPHDLFEWIIKNIFSISAVPSNRIAVEKLKEASRYAKISSQQNNESL